MTGKSRLLQMTAAVFLVAAVLCCTLAPACADGFTTDQQAINEKIKSVVMLTIYDKLNQPVATGSGFVIFDNRTLVTNYHVIKNASSIIAESDEGYKYFVTGIISADPDKDIAILQFMAPTVMQPLDYAVESPVRGAPIVVIGSPQGLKNSVSTGVISSLHEGGQNWIQFTAPISPGSSGGPVFDDSGNVVGMTTMYLSEGQNLNFAVDINDIVDLYQSWDQKTVTEVGSGFPAAAAKPESAADAKPDTSLSDPSGTRISLQDSVPWGTYGRVQLTQITDWTEDLYEMYYTDVTPEGKMVLVVFSVLDGAEFPIDSLNMGMKMLQLDGYPVVAVSAYGATKYASTGEVRIYGNLAFFFDVPEDYDPAQGTITVGEAPDCAQWGDYGRVRLTKLVDWTEDLAPECPEPQDDKAAGKWVVAVFTILDDGEFPAESFELCKEILRLDGYQAGWVSAYGGKKDEATGEVRFTGIITFYFDVPKDYDPAGGTVTVNGKDLSIYSN